MDTRELIVKFIKFASTQGMELVDMTDYRYDGIPLTENEVHNLITDFLPTIDQQDTTGKETKSWK